MFTVFSQQLMFITTITIFAIPPVSAHIFYVDPEYASASDENNGTEISPWKTLGMACKQADSGDIVLVKAGVYHETLRPIRDGVIFAVYGNDSVILSAPIYIFSSNALQLCSQHDSCFTFASPVNDPLLIVDGKAAMRVSDAKGFIQRSELNIPRYYMQDGLIHLFMQGSNQPDKLEILPGKFKGIDLQVNNTTIRGFEIIDCHTGIHDRGQHNLIEDCVTRKTWFSGFIQRGVFGILRRCTAFDGFCFGFNTGDSIGVNVVEECIAIRIRTDLPERVFRDPEIPLWSYGHPFRTGNSNYNVYRYNVAGDSDGKGWWPDVNVYGSYFYGSLLGWWGFFTFGCRLFFQDPREQHRIPPHVMAMALRQEGKKLIMLFTSS